jgi:hypothetical protein
LVLGLPGYTLQYSAEGSPSCWPSTPQKRFNITHLVCDKGAIGSAPQLRDNPFCNGNACTGPFFNKKEVLA